MSFEFARPARGAEGGDPGRWRIMLAGGLPVEVDGVLLIAEGCLLVRRYDGNLMREVVGYPLHQVQRFEAVRS